MKKIVVGLLVFSIFRISADGTVWRKSIIDTLSSAAQEVSVMADSIKDSKLREEYEEISDELKEAIDNLKKLPFPRTDTKNAVQKNEEK